MTNFPSRFLFLITILIAARIGGVFFYDSRLSKPQELPDPAFDYTFAEYTAAKATLKSFEGPYDEASIDILIRWFGHGEPEMGEIAERKLREASARDENIRDLVNAELVSVLLDQCPESRRHIEDSEDHRTLQIASNILADQKVEAALDPMIECSTVIDNIAGNFVTTTAVAKYGEIAVPLLISKYETARPELRHRIVNLIASIGGPNAVKRLIYLRRGEHDPKMRKILSFLIERKQNW